MIPSTFCMQGRREPQPELELRRGGADARPGGRAAARAPDAQPGQCAAAVARHAHGPHGRRVWALQGPPPLESTLLVSLTQTVVRRPLIGALTTTYISVSTDTSPLFPHTPYAPAYVETISAKQCQCPPGSHVLPGGWHVRVTLVCLFKGFWFLCLVNASGICSQRHEGNVMNAILIAHLRWATTTRTATTRTSTGSTGTRRRPTPRATRATSGTSSTSGAPPTLRVLANLPACIACQDPGH